jgi:hypothetical protein
MSNNAALDSVFREKVINGRAIIFPPMSDIFFTESSEAPVPPNEVRVRTLTAVPRRDGKRIDVHAALTPFQKRPNIEVAITNAAGDEVAAINVVEAIDPNMDFTMHLREQHSGGHYVVKMRVFYANIEEHQAAAAGETSAGEILRKAKEIIDQRQVEFEIPE